MTKAKSGGSSARRPQDYTQDWLQEWSDRKLVLNKRDSGQKDTQPIHPPTDDIDWEKAYLVVKLQQKKAILTELQQPYGPGQNYSGTFEGHIKAQVHIRDAMMSVNIRPFNPLLPVSEKLAFEKVAAVLLEEHGFEHACHYIETCNPFTTEKPSEWYEPRKLAHLKRTVSDSQHDDAVSTKTPDPYPAVETHKPAKHGAVPSTPEIQESLFGRGLACIHCFATGIHCDSQEDCHNCTEKGLRCERKKCFWFKHKAIACQKKNKCKLAHHDDGYVKLT